MITDRDREKLEKLLNMLTSDFDAERAIVGAKIADMAKAEKKTVVELLKTTLASKDRETGSHNYGFHAERNSYKPRDPYKPSKLSELESLIDDVGDSPLTSWERNFVNDILERRISYLSEKQEAVVDRILKKLHNYAEADF